LSRPVASLQECPDLLGHDSVAALVKVACGIGVAALTLLDEEGSCFLVGIRLKVSITLMSGMPNSAAVSYFTNARPEN